MRVSWSKNGDFKINKPNSTQAATELDDSYQASPSLFRRMAIILYDSILLFAVLFLATALALPFNNGEAFNNSQFLYPFYLISISLIFYSWFWTHGGQTLGLKTWKYQILTQNRQPITWKQAFFRYCFSFLSLAIFGLGFFWVFFDKNNLALHDRLSKTRLYSTH